MNEEDFYPEWDGKDCRLENNGIIPKSYGYNKKFKYDVELVPGKVLGDHIDWCVANCKHKWGWYFDDESRIFEDERTYISFSNKQEAFLFKVTNL